MGIAILTVFGVPSHVSCQDQGRACPAWSGLVGMKAELGHSLTVNPLASILSVPLMFPSTDQSDSSTEKVAVISGPIHKLSLCLLHIKYC